MTELLKITVSLSLSGSLVILLLLLLKPLLRNRVSKRWQYWMWLIAVARLLFPISPENSPVGSLFQSAVPTVFMRGTLPAGNFTTAPGGAPGPPIPETAPSLAPAQILFLIWLGGALLLLVRKLSVYQSFVRCSLAGSRAVSAPVLLDRLAQMGEETGVRRPVELYENPLMASPMLLGVLRPRIFLPSLELEERDFEYTLRHELIHCKHRDLACKWLVCLVCCLHWFNPLVWRMAREMDRACELACDEAVLDSLSSPQERRAYGDTLLRALKPGGFDRIPPGSAPLSEGAKFMKERLQCIMKFQPSAKWISLLSLLLAAVLTAGTAAAGAYTGPAQPDASASSGRGEPVPKAESENASLRAALLAQQSYEKEDVAKFSMLFPFLRQEEQAAWLERCYQDGSIAFFSSCFSQIPDSSLAGAYAERSYADGRLSFFSSLTDYMDGDVLNAWINRVSQDNRVQFLVPLLEAAGRDEEKDALEEKMAQEYEAKQLEEYKAAGITKEGKVYTYQGNVVRVFLDLRPDRSFYTLNRNPLGTLDLKVTRGEDGGIESVCEMSQEEVLQLFGD